ncbi:MAG: hypothetical protein RLZ27_213, partial [Pseudomonadota bacterium]
SDWQKQYQHFSEEQIEFAGKSKELKIH